MSDVRTGLAGLWSDDQLAEYCRVSPATVHQWLYKGSGPRSLKVGRYRRFRQEDVEAWIEDRADSRQAVGRA